MALPDEALVRAAARRSRAILCLDIETQSPMCVCDPLFTRARIDADLARFATIAGWVKDERPDLSLGFLESTLLAQNFWYATSTHNSAGLLWTTLFGQWGYNRLLETRANQTQLVPARVWQSVDYLMPGVYCGEQPFALSPIEAWEMTADASLPIWRMAGKPIILFLRATKKDTLGQYSAPLTQAEADRMVEWCDANGLSHCWWNERPANGLILR